MVEGWWSWRTQSALHTVYPPFLSVVFAVNVALLPLFLLSLFLCLPLHSVYGTFLSCPFLQHHSSCFLQSIYKKVQRWRVELLHFWIYYRKNHRRADCWLPAVSSLTAELAHPDVAWWDFETWFDSSFFLTLKSHADIPQSVTALGISEIHLYLSVCTQQLQCCGLMLWDHWDVVWKSVSTEI